MTATTSGTRSGLPNVSAGQKKCCKLEKAMKTSVHLALDCTSWRKHPSILSSVCYNTLGGEGLGWGLYFSSKVPPYCAVHPVLLDKKTCKIFVSVNEFAVSYIEV